jgi:hypothetical protein
VPQVQLYETPAEYRARRREESRKFYLEFNAAFGARLIESIAVWEEKHGRKLKPSELAAMLRERTGKAVTARYVGRWYKGLACPRPLECMSELGKILDVRPTWLVWGEGEPQAPSRGVYTSDDGLSFRDNGGEYLGDIKLASRDNEQSVVDKCWELLDLVSPVRPMLRIES